MQESIDLLSSGVRGCGCQEKGNPYFCDIDFDLTKIGEEEAKLHGMTREQSKGEVQYKMALKMLDILMRRGIVSEEEYEKIDHLNRQSFSPQLAKVYA